MSSGGTQCGSSRYLANGYLMKRSLSAREVAARILVILEATSPSLGSLALTDHTQALADAGEGFEQASDLLGGVVGVDAGADDALSGGHAGGQRGGREDSLFPQTLPEDYGELVGADQNRHDLGLRTQSVEAQIAEPLPQLRGVSPQSLPVLGLGLHDLEGFESHRHLHSRERRREDKGAAVVLDVVDHGPRARHEPAHGGERLGEGADYEIDLLLQAEVLGGAPAALSQHAGGVRVVHGDARPVLAGQLYDARQVRDVAAHGEDAVGDDHAPARLVRVPGEQPLQVVQIIVPVLAHRAEGEPRPVVEAGVVLPIEVEDILAAG